MPSIEESRERFERQMNGVAAANNLAIAALGIRFRSEVAPQESCVVLTVSNEAWSEFCDQADMFLAVLRYIQVEVKLEQGESNGND